uniref:Uncharacterized protein n=1 Tax=Ananas comosus var. bracteatus TaxID=296719 RepID=A0A6V7NEQ3_ANACO|nr:unnamed protein product [Ananas comosus var. bracteatus]
MSSGGRTRSYSFRLLYLRRSRLPFLPSGKTGGVGGRTHWELYLYSSHPVWFWGTGAMAPKRRPVTRSTLAPPPEVPEQSGSEEVRELRAQIASMVGTMQRQEDQIARLQQLVAQLASAQANVERPAPSVVVPVVTKGVATAAVPVAVQSALTMVATGSGTSNPEEVNMSSKFNSILYLLSPLLEM